MFILKTAGAVLFLFFVLTLTCQAVTVGPAKLDYTANPGDDFKGEIFLMNEGGAEKTFYPVFEGFIEEGGGTRKFLPDAPDLAKWFKIEESVTLASKEQRNIPFEINIPQNTDPGGYYAVMWWATAPANYQSKPGEQVAIIDRAGILVYLRVSGDIKEAGEISDFYSFSTTTNKQGGEKQVSKRIFNSLPINFSITFKNTGHIHLKPKGEVKIKDIWGKTRAVFKINEFDFFVLPKAHKSFNFKWEAGALFGVYRAEAEVIFGESEQKVQKSFWFLVLPWKLVLMVVLLLAFLIFILPWLIKRYNKWVIKQAQDALKSQLEVKNSGLKTDSLIESEGRENSRFLKKRKQSRKS